MELRHCPIGGAAMAGACGNWTKDLLQGGAQVEVQSLVAVARTLSGAVVRPVGAPFGVYVGDFYAIAEQTAAMLAQVAQLAVFGALAWACQASAQRSLMAKQRAILGLAVVWALAPFAAFAALDPTYYQSTNFGMSMVAIGGFWKLVELALRTGPKGFDRDFRQWMIYYVAPGEVAFDDEGRIKAAPKGLSREITRSVVGHCGGLLLLLLIGDRTGFVPGLARGSDPTAMPRFGFPWSVPALFFQTWTFYCLLCTIFQFWRLVLAAVGFATEVPFRQPLLCSTCIRDFWGRRWNLIIHRIMKRSAFAPCAKRFGPQIGAVAAFTASGLFHEYMWVVINWKEMLYTPGGPLAFFGLQFVFCTAESLLKSTPLGRLAGMLPRPVQTALTLLVPMPFAGLFLQGIYAGGLMPAMSQMMPHLVLV